MQNFLYRAVGYLCRLFSRKANLERFPGWLQEKFQDEFEWQARHDQQKRSYSHHSQDLLRPAQNDQED